MFFTIGSGVIRAQDDNFDERKRERLPPCEPTLRNLLKRLPDCFGASHGAFLARHMDPTFQNILWSAAEAGASDIHIKTGRPVVYRIDRQLHPIDSDAPTDEWLRDVINSIIPANLSEAFAAGRELDFAFSAENIGRFRASVSMQRGQLTMAVRLVKNHIPAFAELNLPDVVRQIAESPRGIVIVAGAVGSGKSTTLAAMIEHINTTARKHIVTLEDPIEFVFEEKRSVIEQREIGLDTVNFSTGLRHMLRQDPDVIVIGEMRDAESAMTGLSAANIGHLVITTLHTTDAVQSVQRVVEFFPAEQRDYARQLFATNLRGVVCQRLIRSVNSGLLPAIEVLRNNVSVTKAIADDETEKLPGIIDLSRQEGMQTFDQALRELVTSGRITQDEALANAANPGALRMSFQGVSMRESSRILGAR